ncbi:hypothetical protein [Clostridium intestinale]|jgi:hypothetical protein|uniref:DUF3784 domain-containing protein n=2 Tax=Clostridium intestinale TaxID=36845 RepID=U2Q213_9CLOT|nr:hypothetical protein [Clostridium intestinale]ERK30079.1 hypothetical protein CINTURNW_1179 [Clostridium intestinale URNW]QLY78545.1 hypothetical protein HZF06_15815 [Clostridium intestinale]
MNYQIAGIIFVLVACLGGIFVFKNRKNMPKAINGLRREKYEIIDEVKLNNVMIWQSISASLCSLLIGVACIFVSNRIVIMMATWILIGSILFFNYRARKHIKIIK